MQLKVCVHLCVCAIFLTILWTFSSFQLYYMDLILCIYCVWFFFFFLHFIRYSVSFHSIHKYFSVFFFHFHWLWYFLCVKQEQMFLKMHGTQWKLKVTPIKKKKRRNEKRKSAVKQHKSIGLWLLFKVLENDRQSSFWFSTQTLATNWKNNPANELKK